MNLTSLEFELKKVGIPVVYHAWEADCAPNLPWIVFYKEKSEDFYADNRNYAKFTPVSIELYTERKDFELEVKIEEILEANEIPYESVESYIDSEDMYEVLYEITLTPGGEENA